MAFIPRKPGFSKSGTIHHCYPKTLRKFLSSERGNFAIMTGLIAPTLIIGTLYGTDAYYRASITTKFQEYVQQACYRALKITRTQLGSDADRKEKAESVFNGSFPAEYKNLKTSVEVKMTEATATASADFEPLLHMADAEPEHVQYTFHCTGIPPYPTDGKIVYNDPRKEYTGSTYETGKCWWSLYASSSSWDDGYEFSRFSKYIYGAYRNINGPLVKQSDGSLKRGRLELQWWGMGRGGKRSGCWKINSSKDVLPAYSTSTIDHEYAYELDYYNNTEIYKDMELHPGHYQMGFWYYARNSYPTATATRKERLQKLTSVIGGYVWGTGNLSYVSTTLGCVSGPNTWGWRYVHFNFIVSTYGIYRVILRGEGLNDGVGGLINSVRMTYLNDLNTPKIYYNSDGEPEHKIEETAAYMRPSCTKWALDQWG